MVTGVSFGNKSLTEIVKEEPKYKAQQQTQAASTATIPAQGLQGDTVEKSGGTGGKIVKGLFILAAVAGGLALLRGKVTALKELPLEKGFGGMETIGKKVQFCIAQAGQWVIDGALATKGWFMKMIGKGEGIAK